MINEEKNSQTHEQEEFLSVNVPENHQSENASEKRGLVSVVYHASRREFDREIYEENSFEEDEHEWHEADSELPARIEYLRENADSFGYSPFRLPYFVGRVQRAGTNRTKHFKD